MSRSFRHTLKLGNTCAPSDKPGKVAASRATRRRVNALLSLGEEILPDDRELTSLSDRWSWPKDGKSYLDPQSPNAIAARRK